MLGISPMQLAIILLIVIMIFGTKKLRNMGGDLGGAIRSFKKAMNEKDEEEGSDDKADSKPLQHQQAEEKDASFSKTSEHDKQ